MFVRKFAVFIFLYLCIFFVFNFLIIHASFAGNILGESNNTANKQARNIGVLITSHTFLEHEYFQEQKNKFYNFFVHLFPFTKHVILVTPKNIDSEISELEKIYQNSQSFFGNKNTQTTVQKIKEKFGEDIPIYLTHIKPEQNIFFHTQQLEQKIKSFISNLPEEDYVLVIIQTDFSRYVHEPFAQLHDQKSIQALTFGEFQNLEVECPNCLALAYNLAQWGNLGDFHVFDRISKTGLLNKQMGIKNMSFVFGGYFPIFGENKKTGNQNIIKLLKQEVKKFQKTFHLFQAQKYYHLYTPRFGKVILGKSNGKMNTEKDKKKGSFVGIAFGDAHFTRGIPYRFKQKKITPEELFRFFYEEEDIKKQGKEFFHTKLFGFDMASMNLETAVAHLNECSYIAKPKLFLFRTHPDGMNWYKQIGINAMTLANNHSYDCNVIGYEATKKHLQEQGFVFFGDGIGNESVVYETQVRGIKLAFVGYNATTYPINWEEKAKTIQELRQKENLVIINIHWGDEYMTTNNQVQQTIAHTLVDAGANLIIGHHPHVIQNFEIYKHVPIYYSLGNFMFDQHFEETLSGLALGYEISYEGIRIVEIPFSRDPNVFQVKF